MLIYVVAYLVRGDGDPHESLVASIEQHRNAPIVGMRHVA